MVLIEKDVQAFSRSARAGCVGWLGAGIGGSGLAIGSSPASRLGTGDPIFMGSLSPTIQKNQEIVHVLDRCTFSRYDVDNQNYHQSAL